jgi:hypothetical protein
VGPAYASPRFCMPSRGPASGDAWATEWDVEAAPGGAAAAPARRAGSTVGEPREAAARARRGPDAGRGRKGRDAA